MSDENENISSTSPTVGKKKGKKKNRFYLYFWLVFLFPIILFGSYISLVSAGVFGKLPSFEELENPKSNLASEVYSSDLVVIGKYYFQNRSNIHYYELSPNVINALKATEDIRFEEHSGVDLKGLFRVLFRTILLHEKESGGGSTITQQLAKNLFPREEHMSKFRTVNRKVMEWIIAVRLEKNYTKEEILAMYLNTVEFGSNAFGIKSAAKTFYGKGPDSLRVEEAAMLVGMLKAPTQYNPMRNPKSALGRRNVVLGQMYKYDLLNRHSHDSLRAIPINKTLKYLADDQNAGLAPYFREFLRGELNRWCHSHLKADGTPYNLYRDGLKIYTTINSKMQRYAEEAVDEHFPDLQNKFYAHWKGRDPWGPFKEVLTSAMKRSDRYHDLKAGGASEDSIKRVFNTKIPMTIFSWKGERDTNMSPMDSIKYYKYFLQTGFMSMEPQTGFIRAWVGGINYQHFKYDHVRDGKRQVGSTFKPFIYTLAMQEGYSPCFKVPNVRVNFKMPEGQPDWSPQNADGKYGGMLTLTAALANSVNCVSAYLMKQFGPQAVVNMAHNMGITSEIDTVPAICLGTPDLSVFEMIGAYGAFANKGVWTEPIYYTRIEDKNGIILEEKIPKRREAISEETAYLMLNLMEGVTVIGTGAALRHPPYNIPYSVKIAGKTGTTQNNSDGWFMGITPELVSGCWVGCEDRSVHFRSLELGQGAVVALPIWGLYMKKVYGDKSLHVSQKDFTKPENKLSVEIDCSKYKNPNEGNNFNSDVDR